MSKIICDVCGTSYPETAEQCPICGSASVSAGGGNSVADDVLTNEAPYTGGGSSHTRGGRFSKSNVRKRNQGNPYYEMPEEKPRSKPAPQEEPDEEYGYMEPAPKKKSNAVLNVLLVIVIVALLCVTGYIFVQYFLPNLGLLQDVAQPTEPTVIETAAPTEAEPTEEPTVPCVSLTWADESDLITLEGEGQFWLLNFVVSPEDTTDEVVYTSSDESVVTVNSEGRITAVGEGEAVVTITCGNIQLESQVLCAFPEETEAPEEPTGEEGTDVTEEPTEAPAEPLKDVTLKANYSDITLTMKGQEFTFKLTGLSNDEVTWASDNEKVVTVDNGTVTCVGKGTANITVTYGEQTITIIVRCRLG